MDMDQPPSLPSEQRVFVRQNIFADIYKVKSNNLINVDIYQDFVYTNIGSSQNFLMSTGLNVVINQMVEFGPFCSYFVGSQTIDIKDPNQNKPTPSGASKRDRLNLVNYFYCGGMVGYIPLSEKVIHPEVFLDIGLGTMNGIGVTPENFTFPVSYAFLVLKPAIAADVNLLSFLQWRTALQYRFQVGLGNNDESKTGNETSGLEVSTGLILQL